MTVLRRTYRIRKLGLIVLLVVMAALVRSSTAESTAAEQKSLFGERVFLPLVIYSKPMELVVVNPEVTVTWVSHNGMGIDLSLPATWKKINGGQGNLAGVYTALYVVTAADSMLTFQVSVERQTNMATGPADEIIDQRIAQGDQILPVLIQGYSAQLLLPTDDRATTAIIVVEIDNVTYHIQFDRRFWNMPEQRNELGL